MKAYRSEVSEGTLILRPQEDIDCKAIDRLENALNNACITGIETNFWADENTVVIRARRVKPDFFPVDWEPTPPEPVFINGVAT